MQTRLDLIREKQAIEAREAAWRQGIEDLMAYLLSEKFHTDPTVQVADVLRRLGHVHAQVCDAEWAAVEEQRAA